MLGTFATNKRAGRLFDEGIVTAFGFAAESASLPLAYEDDVSSDVEGDFLLCLAALGYTWVCAEHRLDASRARALQSGLARLDHQSLLESAQRSADRLSVRSQLIVTKAQRITRNIFPEVAPPKEQIEARAVMVGVHAAEQLIGELPTH